MSFSLDLSSKNVLPNNPYRISSLKLHHFRNYESLSLECPATPIVLTGKNGAGKTNILEALSLLSPGKGLRKLRMGLLTRYGSDVPWVVHTTLTMPQGEIGISTGLESLKEEARRIVKINGISHPQAILHEWVRILWQTPQSDYLFLEGMSIRRRFVDKLINQLTPSYSKHLYRYEYALRERAQLLRDHSSDHRWLNVLEETLAQESVAIVVDRMEFLSKINAEGEKNVTTFPKFFLESIGLVEAWLLESPALIVEEKIQEALHKNRPTDSLTGGSKIGPHQSEIRVINLDYECPAEVCSTGEQKALLLSLMLAQSRLQLTHCGVPPIILLDEVLAHLDEGRRQHLFEEILALNIQAWLTGTDQAIFEPLRGQAHFFTIDRATARES